jgi:hypothetical protein
VTSKQQFASPHAPHAMRDVFPLPEMSVSRELCKC